MFKKINERKNNNSEINTFYSSVEGEKTGAIVHTTIKQKNDDGSYSVAISSVFLEGVKYISFDEKNKILNTAPF
jgi:hypothetical protein